MSHTWKIKLSVINKQTNEQKEKKKLNQSLKITFSVLSREPETKNGPFWAPLLLSDPAASLIAEVALSGAQAMHSTTWSCSLNSNCNQYKKKFFFSGINQREAKFPHPLYRGTYFAFLRGRNPNSYCLIIWTWCYVSSIRRRPHHSHPLAMSRKRFNAISRSDFPHFNRFVSWTGNYVIASGHEGYARHVMIVSVKCFYTFVILLKVPYFDW